MAYAPGGITHEERLGLYLHQDRVEMRRAAYTIMALSAAFGEIGKPWFDALSKTDEEATAMFNRHQAMEKAKQESSFA